jgi:hypothetical protein
MTGHPGTVVRAAAGAASADVGGEHVILAHGVYFRLRGTAARLWQMLQQPQPVETLTQFLVDEYGVDAARAADDVAAFLEQARARGIVEVVEG